MNEPSTQPHRACFLDGFTHRIRYKAMPGNEVAAMRTQCYDFRDLSSKDPQIGAQISEVITLCSHS